MGQWLRSLILWHPRPAPLWGLWPLAKLVGLKCCQHCSALLAVTLRLKGAPKPLCAPPSLHTELCLTFSLSDFHPEQGLWGPRARTQGSPAGINWLPPSSLPDLCGLCPWVRLWPHHYLDTVHVLEKLPAACSRPQASCAFRTLNPQTPELSHHDGPNPLLRGNKTHVGAGCALQGLQTEQPGPPLFAAQAPLPRRAGQEWGVESHTRGF